MCLIAADPQVRRFTWNGSRQSQGREGGALPAAFLRHLSFSVGAGTLPVLMLLS